MKLVSFNAFRTLRLPDVTYIKPEHYQRHLPLIAEADWLLFPEYWQVGSLQFGLKARLFPSLASYWLGHDKIEMTRAFSTLEPAHVPWTLIEPNTADGAQRIWETLPLPFVAKIPRASEGEGVFLIENRGDWERYRALTPALYAQEYLPIDRDLRIVVVGDEVLGGYWRLRSDRSFHNNVARGGSVLREALPESAVALVRRLAGAFDIDHAGFDVAMVDGHPYVLEFNRLFGNQGLGDLNETLHDHMFGYLQRKLRPSAPGPSQGLSEAV